MTDNTSNTSNQNNNENDDQQNNNTSYGGGGKKICFGADNGCSQEDCDKIRKGLEDCGNTVTFTCIDPNQESHMKGSGADFNVFFVNGVPPATVHSFVQAVQSGSLPFTIFAHPGWAPYHNPNEPEGSLASLENVRNEPYAPEHDANFSSQELMDSTGHYETLGEYVDANSQYVALCWGATLEELVQNICSGSCGGGGGGTTASSGQGAQIKDKTFEHCIKRICAATDSVFLVENNAAILFPYTDWMAYILREKISVISAKQMDPDLYSIEYNNEGFYNKVTVVYGADEETEDTATEKKKQEEEDDEYVIKGPSTTKIKKSMPTGGTQISEQYDALVKAYGELEKKVTTNFPDEETAQYVCNALLIQYVRDFNNSCRVRAIHNSNFIGGTFYVVQDPNTKKSDLFYLNSYTIHKEKDQPITVDMEFKYGPEGAEEILDYQTYGGGSGGGSSEVGGEAASINELAKKAIGNETDPLKKAQKIHAYLQQYIRYASYCCTRYNDDPVKCWQNHEHLNCGDTANLTSAVMRAAGLDAVVVWNPGHFWTVVTINGKEYASDLVGSEGQLSVRAFGEVWQNRTYDKKCGKTTGCGGEGC
ncbi:MAG: transglutaminase domain-containing protein [Bacilli bacterium]|nr:transglutaminase domain-containing protein [Bacilli bacterium]